MASSPSSGADRARATRPIVVALRALATFVTLALFGFGCSRASEPTEGPSRQRAQALSEHELRLDLPRGTRLHDLAMVARSSLIFGSHATVVASQGTEPVTVANSGEGVTRLEPHATLGNVVSVPNVRVGSNARVEGFVTTGGVVQQDWGGTVGGAIATGASLVPAEPFVWTVDFPESTVDTVIPPHGDGVALPGAYRTLSVGSHATLRLSAGTYYVDALSVAWHARVVADTTEGPVLLYVRASLGWAPEVVPDDGARFFLGFLGQGSVAIDTRFNGTLVAPDAALRLPGGVDLRGSFFARSIEASPHARVIFEPFGAWEYIFPPVPILDCVVHFDATHAIAQWGYDNPLEIEVTIPAGPRNLLTPGDARLPTTFAPGRHPKSFLADFGTAQSTWQIGGKTPALADTYTSPRCQSDDVVLAPSIHEPPRGESASAPRTALSGQLQQRTVGTRAGTLGPPVTTPAPQESTFRFIIDDQDLSGGDAACGPRQLSVNVFVNGVGELRNFPGCTNPGACGVPAVYETYERAIPEGQATVPIRIELRERDTPLCGGDDDHLLDAELLADAQSGAILGGSLVTYDDGNVVQNVFLDPGVSRVGASGFGVHFRAEVVNPTRPRVCAAWRAQYIDSGPLPGFAGVEDYLAGTTPENVPASFARAELVVRGGGQAPFVYRGLLDADGCVPAEFSPTAARLTAAPDLLVKLSLTSEACWDPDGGDCTVSAPGGGTRGARMRVILPDVPAMDVTPTTTTRVVCAALTLDPALSEPDCEMQRALPGWDGNGHPGPRVDVVNGSLNEITRSMAIVSHVLRQESLGTELGIRAALLDRRLGTTPGLVTIAPNVAFCLASSAVCGTDVAACVTAGNCSSATANNVIGLAPDMVTTSGTFVPNDTHWKFVVAHELGHVIQENVVGSPGYNYGVGATGVTVPPTCACDHVESSNQIHCLQSLEGAAAAHVEGWAQFFASRVFNDASQTDCTFKYYKEFLNDVRMPGVPTDGAVVLPSGLVSNLPPIPVSCVTPVRWRNNRCFDDTVSPTEAVTRLSTEYDYMGFFYALDTQGGAARLSMTDLFDVFRSACLDGFCGRHPGTTTSAQIGWDSCEGAACNPHVHGLSAAANATFGATDPRAEQFQLLGQRYGVDRNVDR